MEIEQDTRELARDLLQKLHTGGYIDGDNPKVTDIYDFIHQELLIREYMRTGVDIRVHKQFTTKIYRNTTIGFGIGTCVLPLLVYLGWLPMISTAIVYVACAIYTVLRTQRYIESHNLINAFVLLYSKTVDAFFDEMTAQIDTVRAEIEALMAEEAEKPTEVEKEINTNKTG